MYQNGLFSGQKIGVNSGNVVSCNKIAICNLVVGCLS